MDKKKPNFIVNVQGGAGKNVMFTAVAKNIKESFPDHNIVAISPYPEVLINEPVFDRVYRTGVTPYLYDDLVSNHPDNIVSSIEPYGDHSYLLEKEHLIQTWSRLLGAEPKKQLPQISVTAHELNLFKTTYSKDLFNFEKPILVINPFGGPPNDKQKYNWCRDIPHNQAQIIANYYLEKGYAIVQVGRDDQPSLSGVIKFHSNLREIICVLILSQKRLLIDSFCQHAAAGLGLPSTVCWITNKPSVFGYDIHKNILPCKAPEKTIHRIDSMFQENNWEGSWNHYYPYADQNIFNLDQIIASLG